MTRLVWGASGSRQYETGVDRGVLFPPAGAVGVPWNGLISVKEAPSGGEPQAYYMDGVKYYQIASSEEFKATIEALSAPPEFALCDGVASIYAGLAISQQPRKSFGFSYRTLVGNDVSAETYGYKLHLVYGALASPTGRNHSSTSDSVDPMDLSWDIECVPPAITGFKPSAHLVINSLTAPPAVLTAIENIIYGQDAGVNSRMPLVSELIAMFAANANPNLLSLAAMRTGDDASIWTGGGGTLTTQTTVAKSGNNALKMVGLAGGSYPYFAPTTAASAAPVTPGQIYTAVASYYNLVAGKSAHVRIVWYNSAGTVLSSADGSAVSPASGSWAQAIVTATAPAGAAYAGVQIQSDTSMTNTDNGLFVDEIGIFAGTYTTWSA